MENEIIKPDETIIPYEDLGISNDFLFGRIMMDEKICKPFLETLLGMKIHHIEYLEPQKSVNLKIDAHSVRFDIYVDDGKTIYNCEMQTTLNRNLPKRSRYYQGMIDINLLGKSMDYSRLKKSFVIFICTFDPFDRDAYVYTFRNTCREYPEMELRDEAIKIFFNTKGKNGNISPELKNLLEYIQTSEIPEGCEDGLINDLDHALHLAKSNEEWGNDYMTLELLKQEERRKGEIKGEIKGRKEGAAKLGKLVNALLKDKRYSDIEKVSVDEHYREKLYKEFKM